MRQLTFSLKVAGTLTDATSVVMSDPAGTYGVKDSVTDAVAVADGTAMTHASTGVYTYEFEDDPNATYEWYAEWGYGGATYHTQFTSTPDTLADAYGWTDICNAALDLIGAGLDTVRRLDDVNTDTGDTADWFRANRVRAKRAAILRHDWPECIDYLLGTDAAGDVDDINHEPYEYAYAVPAAFGTGATAPGVLAFRGLVDVNDHDEVLLSRGPVHGYVHTDYADTEFAWKLLLDIDSGFSNGLRECITYELAIRAAAQFLTGQAGDQKRRMLMEEYRGEVLPNAKGEAQAEQYDTHNQTRDTPWTEIV